MPNYTDFLHLEKPLQAEQYNVDVFNDNCDKIDNFAQQIPPRAYTADKLTTGVNINGVFFRGDADVVTGLGKHDSTVTYNEENIAYKITDGEAIIKRCLNDETTGDNFDDPTKWQKLLFSGDDYANINLSNLTATGENHFTNKDLSNLTSTGENHFTNKDLSNLTSTGQKVLDGQWVDSGLTIVTGRNSQTATDLEYSLSSYLPSDSYKYEVMFSMIGSTATAKGSTQRGLLSTDIFSNQWRVYIAENQVSANIQAGGSAILPVGTNRKVIVKAHASNTGTFNLYALGYRRIGTNS